MMKKSKMYSIHNTCIQKFYDSICQYCSLVMSLNVIYMHTYIVQLKLISTFPILDRAMSLFLGFVFSVRGCWALWSFTRRSLHGLRQGNPLIGALERFGLIFNCIYYLNDLIVCPIMFKVQGMHNQQAYHLKDCYARISLFLFYGQVFLE